MNREEVIEGLEIFTKDDGMWKYHYCVASLFSEAVALLKEHQAVEPIYDEEKYGDHLPHCGNCEKVLPNSAIYGKVNFCYYCGKAVK